MSLAEEAISAAGEKAAPVQEANSVEEANPVEEAGSAASAPAPNVSVLKSWKVVFVHSHKDSLICKKC